MTNAIDIVGKIIFEATTTLDKIIVREIPPENPIERQTMGFCGTVSDNDYAVEKRIKQAITDANYTLRELIVYKKLDDALNKAGDLCKHAKTKDYR